jgi:nucleotide-binding universal stress UspA family protein
MFKHIVIPLDLTDKHQAAVDRAAGLAPKGGELTLLHVIEAIPGLPDEELEGFYHRIEQKANRHLEAIGQQLTARHIPWHAKVVVGSRVQEIVQYAAQQQSDLIVLTAPQVDPANPATGWASLSWKIAMLASCPVLLVK